MSMEPEEDDDLLAAEYVLGVLPLDQRIAARNREKTDPVFAAMIAVWQARLTLLNDATPEVAPSREVFERLESRLFPLAPRKSWLTGFWAAAGSVLAAAVVVLFFLNAAPTPTLTATLAANDSEISYLVQISSAGISATRSGPGPAAGQAHELWLIVGDAAPVSLGLIDEAPLPLPDSLTPGMILAVSLEPAGGSTAGAPTGPVLSLGALEKI